MQISVNVPHPAPTDVGASGASPEESQLRALGASAPLKRQESVTKEANFQEEELAQLLQKAEETSRIFGRDIKFRYQKEADLYQVEIVDRQENKVIRKIPPDEIVHLIENINTMLGAIFDKKF